MVNQKSQKYTPEFTTARKENWVEKEKLEKTKPKVKKKLGRKSHA